MARFFYFAGGIVIVVFGVVLPIWQRISQSSPVSAPLDLQAVAYLVLSGLLGSAITGLMLIAVGAILSRLDIIVANTSGKSDARALDT